LPLFGHIPAEHGHSHHRISTGIEHRVQTRVQTHPSPQILIADRPACAKDLRVVSHPGFRDLGLEEIKGAVSDQLFPSSAESIGSRPVQRQDISLSVQEKSAFSRGVQKRERSLFALSQGSLGRLSL
jgi:hypothetical protein